MNINRGNQFVRLVSMGSQSLGLNLYAAKAFGPDSPKARKHYALSDVVSTLIQTAEGQTIALTHDTDFASSLQSQHRRPGNQRACAQVPRREDLH